MNLNWHTETRKTDRNPPITNHKPWPFEPDKAKFCFPRGPLRWLTAAKNAIVSWLLNFTIRMFVKSAVRVDRNSLLLNSLFQSCVETFEWLQRELQLTLTLMTTTAQVVETSVTVHNNCPIQDYVHPDDQTHPNFEMTPGFKPFTIIDYVFSFINSCNGSLDHGWLGPRRSWVILLGFL